MKYNFEVQRTEISTNFFGALHLQKHILSFELQRFRHAVAGIMVQSTKIFVVKKVRKVGKVQSTETLIQGILIEPVKHLAF